MKSTRVLLFAILCLVPTFTNAQPSLLGHIPLIADESPFLTPTYLKELEELGYCIIPQVISVAETEILYQRNWHEFIEKAWPNCKINDRSNWKETFPMHNLLGIFAGPAGQTQVMWDVRQDPRIVDVFAKVWNTSDLIVSMDGQSFMCPTEIREVYFEPWPHVDQAVLRRNDGVAHNNNPPIDFVSESSLKTKPYTIQGQFLFEDSCDGDGGFYCIPKSHLKFSEYALELETLDTIELSIDEKKKVKSECFQKFFVNGTDESGNSYIMQHVTAPKGSLILWDSRTVHWNQHPNKNRPHIETPRVRMVGYLCYVPKGRLTDEGRATRREAFELGVSTGHNPAYPELKYTKDHIWKEFEWYLEDPSYVQPKINLTQLGESLLAI